MGMDCRTASEAHEDDRCCEIVTLVTDPPCRGNFASCGLQADCWQMQLLSVRQGASRPGAQTIISIAQPVQPRGTA